MALLPGVRREALLNAAKLVEYDCAALVADLIEMASENQPDPKPPK